MAWIAALAAVGGALLASEATGDAADTQAEAANNATGISQKQFEQVRADQAPWRAAGENALAKLTSLLNDGSITSKFAGQVQNEPGYAFAAREGQRAIDNSAAARGGIGGASLKAGVRFAEDNANKFYNEAFNRFQTERTNMLEPLFRLGGFGTQANQQVGQAGQNYANQAGQNMLGAANAQAAAGIAQGNIYGNMLNQGVAQWNRRNTQPYDPAFDRYTGGNLGSGD